TSAGVSSLLLAEKYLPAGRLDGAKGAALHKAIADGYGWLVRHLERHGARDLQLYDAYSLEKVGDLGAVESFGAFRWYDELARAILALPRKEGAWGRGKEHDKRRSETCLALLFLERATAVRARSAARVTGAAGAGGAGASSEAWVYLPSLKGEVLLPRLFR